eukprot:31212-Pelagococcus_subviridis.AAC.2
MRASGADATRSARALMRYEYTTVRYDMNLLCPTQSRHDTSYATSRQYAPVANISAIIRSCSSPRRYHPPIPTPKVNATTVPNASNAATSPYTAARSPSSSNPSTSNWPIPGTSRQRIESSTRNSQVSTDVFGGFRASRNSSRSLATRLFRTTPGVFTHPTSSIVSTWRASATVLFADGGASGFDTSSPESTSTNRRRALPLTRAAGSRMTPVVAAP